MPGILPLRDLARTVALKSNRYWPFSWTNRAIYRAAARMFSRTYSHDSEVCAIYLRHTMASGDWTPGLSDIDVSVILRRGLQAGREFAFLTSFWERFARLKRLWPMLGEVDVLGEDELAVWKHYSARSVRPPAWQLLAGRGVASALDFAPSERWRVRALRTAFWFYMERFLPSLDGGASFLEVKDRQRLARKILSLTADAAEAGAPPAVSELETDTGPLLARVVRALDAAVTAPGPPIPTEGSPFGPCLPMDVDGVNAVVFDYSGRAFIVVREGLVAAALTEVREACRRLPVPVFLTPAMFRFFLGDYEPKEYGYFDKGRAIAFGADPFPSCQPPSQEQFDHAVLDRIPNVLQYARSIEVIGGEASAGEMADQLRRFLPVLRVLGGDAAEERFEAGERLTPGREAFLLFRQLSGEVLRSASRMVCAQPEPARQ